MYVEANGEVLHDEFSNGNFQQGESSEVKLDFNKIYDFAMETPLDDLHFMLEAARLNKMAAEESKKGSFGHSVARVIENESFLV